MLPLRVKAFDLLDTCQTLLVHVQVAFMLHSVLEMRLGFAGMWADAPLWIFLLGPVDRAAVVVDDDCAASCRFLRPISTSPALSLGMFALADNLCGVLNEFFHCGDAEVACGLEALLERVPQLGFHAEFCATSCLVVQDRHIR